MSYSRQMNYRKRKPWVRLLEWARRRCNDKSSRWWPYYGAKGVRCELTLKELEILWHRDVSDKMQRPSLDRKDSDGNYTFSNCRIIEFRANVMLAGTPGFGFLSDKCGSQSECRRGGCTRPFDGADELCAEHRRDEAETEALAHMTPLERDAHRRLQAGQERS